MARRLSSDKSQTPENQVARLLFEARNAKKLSLRDVQLSIGISNAYLSQLETGKVANPSPHFLQKLSELYGLQYDAVMAAAGYAVTTKDLFLSHRSADKEFARRVAADIQAERMDGHNLRVWLDEAEISPGDSIPRVITEGLEKSRYIALFMTPSYFESASGWTDAEWHGTLHSDPDNRKGRLLPLLVKD